MSEFQSGFTTTLTKKLNPSDTVIYIEDVITVTAGRLYLINDSQREWIGFESISGGGLILGDLTRNLSQTADPITGGTGGTGLTWLAGTEIVLVSMHDQLPNKNQANTWRGDQTIAEGQKIYLKDTGAYVYRSGDDLILKDPNNSERTLSELSSLSGSNDKTKVSENDTIEDYLENKTEGGNGVSISITNEGGDEKINIGIDTSDTEIFVKESSGAGDENKAVILNENGQIENGFIKGNIGGDGSDGALNISSGTTTLDFVNGFIEKNYSSITISGTATLSITGGSYTTIGATAFIKCLGDFTMSGGTIDISGTGGNGGAGGGTSSAGSNGISGRNSQGLVHYGIAGGTPSGGVGILGPYSLTNLGNSLSFFTGGGGAGGEGNSNAGGNGGNGGGLLVIEVGGDFNFTGGTIKSNGANGTASASGGGGGGGGGGTIIIVYNTLTSNTGTIQCNGGNGGQGAGVSTDGGGGGAGYTNGGAGSVSSGSAGTNGTASTWGTGGTGGALPNGGGGGGAGLYIVKNINQL